MVGFVVFGWWWYVLLGCFTGFCGVVCMVGFGSFGIWRKGYGRLSGVLCDGGVVRWKRV